MIAAIYHSVHMLRVGLVLFWHGVFALLPRDKAPLALRPVLAFLALPGRGGTDGAGLVRALTALGPSYVKLGQFLATRPDLIGVKLARDLQALQDRMPAVSRAQAVLAVEAAFDAPISTLFRQFGEPVAAASIAQVHRAQIALPIGGADLQGNRGLDTPETRDVAVKILRPGIEALFTRDLAAQAFIARQIERFMPASRRLKPVEVVRTLARTVQLEMDLRFEAAAYSEMAEYTAKDPDFTLPAIDWHRTARTVLTLDWVEGIKLNDLEGLEQAGIDRVNLARVVMQSFLTHALRDGFFHADMHPGNLFALPDGRLVAIDLGIMSRLNPRERRFLAEILYGFIVRDYPRIARAHFEIGYVPAHHSVENFAQALRAVGEKIHGRSADEVSMAALLGLLFEITALFDMETRPELVLLQKTMVVVEGVARLLDPGFNMWQVSDPVIRTYIERHLGPAGQLETFASDIRSGLRALSHLPALVADTQQLLAQQPLAAQTHARREQAARRQRRWLIGLLALLNLWLLGVILLTLVEVFA